MAEVSEWQKEILKIIDDALCYSTGIESVQVSYTMGDILVSPQNYDLPELVIRVEQI